MMNKQSTKNTRKFKYGGYAIAIVVLVIAAVIAVNIGVAQLTKALNLEFDLTRNNRYTISAVSRKVAKELKHDVTIYAMFSEEMKASYPEYTKLFENFAGETDHISIQYVDPTTNPQFANKFIGGTVTYISAGAVIVSRSDDSKFRVLDSYDFYEYSYDTTTYSSTPKAFKGEEAVANALLYVDSDVSPKVYWLTGHEEEGVAQYAAVVSYLAKENYECADLDATMLANLEKGDVLVISAPKRDLTADELSQIGAFVEDGGRLIYLSSDQDVTLPNFEELFELYGVTFHHDLVYESDANYWFSTPLLLVPEIASHETTSVVRENKLTVYFPYAQWLETSSIKSNILSVTPLLTTSSSAYAKTNHESTVAEMEEGDAKGPFDVAVVVEKVDPYGETANDVRIAVFSSSYFATQLGAYGGNIDLFLQTVRWMQNAETNVVSIVGKSLSEDLLSIRTATQAYTACVVVVAVIPVLVLAAGIVVWLRRRHL